MSLPLPRILRRFLPALAWLMLAGPAAAARPPVLMLLAHAEAGKPIVSKIEAKAGLVTSPDQGKRQVQWFLRAGEAVKSAARPADRVVSFYQGTGTQSALLFIVKLRYYPNNEGRWVAQFQIDQEPLVARVNGRWQPLTTVQGVPSLIVITSNTLPNAEGYFASLDFSFTTGPTSIDAWMVQ
jgi:hypothetical protein